MKRFLKILGIALGLIVLLLAGVAAYINFSGIPTYENKAPDISFDYTPERVAKGERIVAMVCADCHRGEGNKLSGKRVSDIPKEFGTAYSSNITNDPDYGVGAYTDGEIMYLLRTGIKKNGAYAPPYMPKFHHMADEDIFSVIAYLRSDAPPVQAVAKASVPSEPSFLVKMLCRVAFKPLPMQEEPVLVPDSTDKVALGEYIAHGMVNCFDCHSANFKTNNPLEPIKSLGYMGGGNPMPDHEGNIILTSNITMHPEFGIGKWTEEEFVRCVKTGVRPDGTMTRYPMLKLTAFNDEELSAVYAYLKTVPVSDNEVIRTE